MEIEAGPAEHLPFQHLQPVDVAFDGAGTVGKGQSVADGVEVAAQVAGEAREWGEGVSFDLGDPVLEAVAVACGHHDGELPDVKSEPVQLGIAFTQPVKLADVLVRQVFGVSHDP